MILLEEAMRAEIMLARLYLEHISEVSPQAIGTCGLLNLFEKRLVPRGHPSYVQVQIIYVVLL